MGDKPHYRLIRRKADDSGWESIGAAWDREKGGFSVSLEIVKGEKIKCLLVKNEERKPPEPPRDDYIPF